jgi:GR25 family glycosyltransferase involved in LPS biosynthesis
MELPLVYCINLESKPEKKANMERRFQTAGITNYRFVKATQAGAPILDYYAQGLKRESTASHNVDGIHGCFVSHLRAIRKFVKTGKEECLIIEDDVLLAKNFIDKFNNVKKNIPDSCPLAMLSYIVNQWNMPWAGIDVNKENLCQMKRDSTWGTQMYLIKRPYALKCLENFDKPFVHLTIPDGDYLTSELITRSSLGLICYPPLAIEDSALLHEKFQTQNIDPKGTSDLRCDVRNQARAFAAWGVQNFDS